MKVSACTAVHVFSFHSLKVMYPVLLQQCFCSGTAPHKTFWSFNLQSARIFFWYPCLQPTQRECCSGTILWPDNFENSGPLHPVPHLTLSTTNRTNGAVCLRREYSEQFRFSIFYLQKQFVCSSQEHNTARWKPVFKIEIIHDILTHRDISNDPDHWHTQPIGLDSVALFTTQLIFVSWSANCFTTRKYAAIVPTIWNTTQRSR